MNNKHLRNLHDAQHIRTALILYFRNKLRSLRTFRDFLNFMFMFLK